MSILDPEDPNAALLTCALCGTSYNPTAWGGHTHAMCRDELAAQLAAATERASEWEKRALLVEDELIKCRLRGKP